MVSYLSEVERLVLPSGHHLHLLRLLRLLALRLELSFLQ
jgi:hypothetical protein